MFSQFVSDFFNIKNLASSPCRKKNEGHFSIISPSEKQILFLKSCKEIDKINNIGIYWNVFLKPEALFNFIKSYLLFILKINQKKGKIIVDFGSFNPIGDFHIGNTLGLIHGDVFCNLNKFIGNNITKCFHVSDKGNQINQ